MTTKNFFLSKKNAFEKITSKLDIDLLKTKFRELETKSLKSDFWEDIKSATETMQQIADVKTEIARIESLEQEAKTLYELVNLTSEEAKGLDVVGELKKFKQDIDNLELNLFLSDKFDNSGVFLSVHSGQGGVEAMDWAAMVLRMYTRFAEKRAGK